MALTKITRGVIKANENYDTHNINSTGIVTAVTFTGNVTGVAATFTGDVSIGGTLTYQDVTNIDSVGIITAQSDISIADKIVHTGDTNTALRFPAADTITAETGGTERLRITSGGAVQITGVDDQDNLLVKGGSTHFAVHQDDTDGEVSLRAQDGSGSNNSKYMTFFTNPSGSAAAERLRITSAGFLGINETSPDSVLHVKSGTTNDVATFESTDAYAHIYIKDNSTHATGTYFGVQGNDFRFITHDGSSSSERVRITSDGKVGVGIAAPNVFGVHANNSSNSVYFKADSGSVSTVYGSATALGTGVLGTFTNHALAFYTNSNEKLRITSDGDVCVGGHSSNYANSPLEVRGTNAGGDVAIRVTNNSTASGTQAGIIFTTTTADYTTAGIGFERGTADALRFYVGQSAGGGGFTNATERLRITSGGKVCVNTTLSNYGTLQIRDASGDSITSAIQVENPSSGNDTTNVILRSVNLNSAAWANAEYRAKRHHFCFEATPVLSVLGNFGPWAEGNKGTTRGTLHLRPGSTDHMGGAITFGASDSGSGETAMAGIYTRSDGTYGTKMYFATTNSYATGPKNAMFIDHYGYVHDSNRPYIYGSPTNTNGSGVANSMHVESSRNLSFSNSRITVPVSGVYHICFNTITDSGTGRVDAHIRINGVSKVNSLNDTNTSGYHYRGLSISLMLSENDYIQFNNNDWYNSGTTTIEYWRTASVVYLG